MMDKYWNKCACCGRFVSMRDIIDGKAIHRMLTPDSHLTMEEWETLCPEHKDIDEESTILYQNK